MFLRAGLELLLGLEPILLWLELLALWLQLMWLELELLRLKQRLLRLELLLCRKLLELWRSSLWLQHLLHHLVPSKANHLLLLPKYWLWRKLPAPPWFLVTHCCEVFRIIFIILILLILFILILLGRQEGDGRLSVTGRVSGGSTDGELGVLRWSPHRVTEGLEGEWSGVDWA